MSDDPFDPRVSHHASRLMIRAGMMVLALLFVTVTLKDIQGNTLAESQPLSGSKPYMPVQWKTGFKLSSYKGKRVRFGFKIMRAKLYSFKFSEK